MTDRLTADKQSYENVVKNLIEKVDMLKLKSKAQLIDSYMLAFSLGVSTGKRTPSKVKLGVIQESAARGKENALQFIYSVALRDLRNEGKENLINDQDLVFKIAEEYTNTGLIILAGMVPQIDKYDEDAFEFELLQMMDEKYAELMGTLQDSETYNMGRRKVNNAKT